jgi:membrane-bound serine protease (ClpP class)
MRRLTFLFLVSAPIALWPAVARSASPSPSTVSSPSVTASVSPSSEPTRIDVIKVEGALDRPLVGFVDDRLDAAVSDGAVVVLQLDTSGTVGQDGIALAQRVADLPVPVIAWVGPVPARASGAGLLLLYASAYAAVSPGSQTGPLTPIDLAEPGRDYPGLLDTVRGWLDARAKDTDLDHADTALTAQQALDERIAQGSAQSVPELLNGLDGEVVHVGAQPIELHTRIATDVEQAEQGTVDIRFTEIGPVRRVQHGVATPSMAYFLLIAGLACLAFEITQPGFGFAGFSGLALLALAAYGISVVPPSVAGLAMLLGGVALLIADVRLRRLGLLTAAGLVLFGAGSWLAWSHVDEAIQISPWLIGGALVASFLYYGFGLTVAIQSRDRILSTQRGLIGLVGEARGHMAPDGPVFVKGALWRGRSVGGPIHQGAQVRVRGVDGLILKVETEPEPT